MFYLNYVSRPLYSQLKTNPKEYWEQWQRYTKAQLNYQVWRNEMEFDRMAVASMLRNSYANNALMGLPCRGCTLGGGLGIFM